MFTITLSVLAGLNILCSEIARDNITRATIVKSTIYVCGISTVKPYTPLKTYSDITFDGFGSIHLYHCDFLQPTTSLHYSIPTRQRTTPLRTYITGTDFHTIYNDNNNTLGFGPGPLYNGYIRQISLAAFQKKFAPRQAGSPIDPNEGLGVDTYTGEFGPSFMPLFNYRRTLERVSYDFLVHPKQYEYFFSELDDQKKTYMTRWTSPKTSTSDEKLVQSGSKVTFPAGRFYLAASKELRFFITADGKIYRQDKPSAEVVCIWDKSPIRAILRYDDTNTYQVFTKDQYFQLGETINPLPHDVKNLNGRIALEALETARRCAEYLHNTTKKDK
jgi:hypothetical protein